MSQTVRSTLQHQIDQYTREILNATEKSWEALKNKDRKQNIFWLDEKKKLTAERTELQKKLQLTPNQETTIKPKTRQEAKDKIISLNKLAKAADKNMRLALLNKQLSQANDFLRERNQLNAEVKHINELLSPPKVDQKVVASTSNKAKTLSRAQIKEKIRDCNAKALSADKKMRIALANRELEKANELLQQRNYLNSEAKKWMLQLTPPSIANKTNNATQDRKKSQVENEEKNTSLMVREELKNRVRALNAKALQADKSMRVALAEKRLMKANELLQQRNQFNTKAKELIKRLQALPTVASLAKPSKREKVLSRAEIKAKIREANGNALKADGLIRSSLELKQYKKANNFLKQRNIFTAKAKALNLILNPPKPIATSKEVIPSTTLQTKNMTEKDIVIEKTVPSEATHTPQEHNTLKPIPATFEEKIASQYVNYRLAFVHHFYKKRELEAQIQVEQKNPCDTTDKTIENLEIDLHEHLSCPPHCFVEDNAHNAIILHLLEKTDERGISFFNFSEISKTTIGAALKPLNCQQDLSEFISDYTEEGQGEEESKRVLLKYFIRDIIQVRCSLTINDLVLHDAIMDTASTEYGFVCLFDEIVLKINKEISRLQRESEDSLMPTVLRPIGKFANLGHRDAIQLIPPMQNGVDQFAGAILEDVTIQDNIISSVAKLQGIFSTDGAFKNLKIINNKISTAGEHKVSILGMLSGEITANSDLDGCDLDIKIQPLRLGGGTPITNFFVLGFTKDCSYQYEHIEGISGTKIDRRTKKVVPRKVYDPRKYLLNFDMDYFTAQYQVHDKPKGRFEAIKDIVEAMLKEGLAVTANPDALDALEHGLSQEVAIALAKKVVAPKVEVCDPRMQQRPI